LLPLLEARFRLQPSAHWLDRLLAAGVPCGPVNDIPSALADPQAQARQMVQTVKHPSAGPVPLVGPASKLSATPATIRSAPPLLGEHTESVLHEFLGYDEDKVAELRRLGVV
jgi:crotonobetainyl-CoA:carnitine CoA-transferase CaiB-like acyl-CoA transferase